MQKAGIVKFLSDSFTYCGGMLPTLTEEQLERAHDSPDGHLPGREILLAMFVHVAHHRGQRRFICGIKGFGRRAIGYEKRVESSRCKV